MNLFDIYINTESTECIKFVESVWSAVPIQFVQSAKSGGSIESARSAKSMFASTKSALKDRPKQFSAKQFLLFNS